MLSYLWQLKLRLQFTGWLQYMPPLAFALVVSLLGTLAWLIGSMPVVHFLFALSGLLLAQWLFDLITVKFRLRPPERLPQPKDDLDIFDLMRARRSCRSFQTRKLTPAHYQALMEAVRRHSAESTIGQVPIRFDYVNAPLTVWPVVNATEFLVAIAPKAYNRLAVLDVGRSLQKIVMDATRMGLGTCWIGPGADHASVIHQLGERFDPERDHIICLCAVGYKSAYWPLFLRVMQANFKRRLPLSQLFFADTDFQESLDVTAEPFNHFGRSYEICQWSPSSYNGQTTRCVAVTTQNGVSEPHLTRFDFYATIASRYYAPVAVGIWCANWELGCEALGIQGHSTVLPAAGQAETEAKLPRYDVSWVLDQPIRL